MLRRNPDATPRPIQNVEKQPEPRRNPYSLTLSPWNFMRIIWNGFRKSGFILIGVAGLMLVVSAFAQLGMNIEYHIGFVNKTGHDLDGVCVYYGTIEAAAKGGLVKGGRSTEGPVTLPLPSDAEVRWIGNGVRHAVKAKLQGAVPKRLTYHWTLYFVINEDGTVQAKAIKLGDKAAMAMLPAL